jgi:hypothetical protein
VNSVAGGRQHVSGIPILSDQDFGARWVSSRCRSLRCAKDPFLGRHDCSLAHPSLLLDAQGASSMEDRK